MMAIKGDDGTGLSVDSFEIITPIIAMLSEFPLSVGFLKPPAKKP